MDKNIKCELAEGFSLAEKVWARVSFITMGVVGLLGIALSDWRWLAPYVVLYVYGILGVVMRHLSCPRCPHLHIHGDCLQFPPAATRWLIRRPKSHPFTGWERALFLLIMLAIPVYPLYWLWERPLLLVVFAACTAMWYLGQVFYFCPRCRVKSCPFNRAPGLGACA